MGTYAIAGQSPFSYKMCASQVGVSQIGVSHTSVGNSAILLGWSRKARTE